MRRESPIKWLAIYGQMKSLQCLAIQTQLSSDMTNPSRMGVWFSRRLGTCKQGVALCCQIALAPACLQLEKNGDTMLNTMDWKMQVQEMQKEQVQKKEIEKCNSERSKYEKWRKHAKQMQTRSETNWTNMISEKKGKSKKNATKNANWAFAPAFSLRVWFACFCIVFLHLACVICTFFLHYMVHFFKIAVF